MVQPRQRRRGRRPPRRRRPRSSFRHRGGRPQPLPRQLLLERRHARLSRRAGLGRRRRREPGKATAAAVAAAASDGFERQEGVERRRRRREGRFADQEGLDVLLLHDRLRLRLSWSRNGSRRRSCSGSQSRRERRGRLGRRTRRRKASSPDSRRRFDPVLLLDLRWSLIRLFLLFTARRAEIAILIRSIPTDEDPLSRARALFSPRDGVLRDRERMRTAARVVVMAMRMG